eukprot:jgi/Botrbrau1/18461/Bobra.0072s0044.1
MDFILSTATVSLQDRLLGLYDDGQRFFHVAATTEVRMSLLHIILATVLLGVWVLYTASRRGRPVYLLGFEVYKPPNRLKITRDRFLELSRLSNAFNEKSIEFQEKMIFRGGLGDETYLPEAVHATPPCPTMKLARAEAELVMFETVRNVLAECSFTPKDIDCVIVNCSLFNPTPSLCAMIINHFKMRSDIVSYNLSGMGCSAGLISIALAKELLQTYRNFNVLVVSTENITQNWYFGNQRSMLIPNCLFRVGGAAIILTNRQKYALQAKYELLHCVRTHMGSSDESYGCIYQCEDEAGKIGVHLSKDLMTVAGRALKSNITALGPLVLPLSEQLKFMITHIKRKVLKSKDKPYLPDFTLAFNHICIHTGGRGVIDEMEKQLSLPPEFVAPSREALFRYGNTSSSSIWYILAQIETARGVRRGDKVWQIAFGSGFKCNSAVWRALRTNNKQHCAWGPERSLSDDAE